MKIRVFAILSLIAGSFAFASCIDDQATEEVILNEDLAEIKGYLDTTSMVNLREVYDASLGLTVVWQKISGSGKKSAFGDTLLVDYTGKLLTEKVFDSSIEQIAKDGGVFSSSRKYEPLKFILGYSNLIGGFHFGLLNVEEGDIVTVLMPSRLAYGRQGTADGRIPANTPIMFEMELHKVTPGPQD